MFTDLGSEFTLQAASLACALLFDPGSRGFIQIVPCPSNVLGVSIIFKGPCFQRMDET